MSHVGIDKVFLTANSFRPKSCRIDAFADPPLLKDGRWPYGVCGLVEFCLLEDAAKGSWPHLLGVAWVHAPAALDGTPLQTPTCEHVLMLRMAQYPTQASQENIISPEKE